MAELYLCHWWSPGATGWGLLCQEEKAPLQSDGRGHLSWLSLSALGCIHGAHPGSLEDHQQWVWPQGFRVWWPQLHLPHHRAAVWVPAPCLRRWQNLRYFQNQQHHPRFPAQQTAHCGESVLPLALKYCPAGTGMWIWPEKSLASKRSSCDQVMVSSWLVLEDIFYFKHALYLYFEKLY